MVGEELRLLSGFVAAESFVISLLVLHAVNGWPSSQKPRSSIKKSCTHV
jgi:hypothetical protein